MTLAGLKLARRHTPLAPLGETHRHIGIPEYKSPVVYGSDLRLYSRFIEGFHLTIDREEIFNRFRYHQPSTEDVVEKHAAIRGNCTDLAGTLLALCPESRELSLALTKLDEVCMHANAAVARHQ